MGRLAAGEDMSGARRSRLDLAAARMRRSRERRARGVFMVARLPISHAQVDELVAAKYLEEWDSENRNKVEAAAQKAWNDLFRLRVTDPNNGVV
jgi:hypothetical protein